MKFISWNVNGVRAWIQKDGVLDFLKKEDPDVFCIQESKAQEDQIIEAIEDNFNDYPYKYFNCAEKKGYSGVGVFSKTKPISVSYGIGDDLDSEGRVITVEYKNYFLVTVYTPNSKPDLSRVDYRHDVWDKNFLKHMKKLEKKKAVIVCGDLNVAHNEIDLKNPASNKTTDKNPGNAGFTDKERKSFEKYIEAGFIDSFRFKNPDTVKYSWWSYRFNARKNNSGWRIDYFLTSNSLRDQIKKADIFDEVHGSDHCPVSLEI
jgi:exodeoxyribonuclease-3